MELQFGHCGRSGSDWLAVGNQLKGKRRLPEENRNEKKAVVVVNV